MSEYCEFMWDSTRRPMNLALARSLYDEGGRIEVRDKKLAVKTVRAILRDMPGVDISQCTDEYITRFLLARKYRTEQAAALIAAYQAQILHRQDIFGNLTARDPALQRALRAGIPGVLPARDRKGRCILVILASQWDPIAVPALAVQRAIFLVLEILIQDPRNQHSGFVAVVDWSGFSLRQGGALGAAALRNLIAALRGRFPARFKAVHFLSSPLCVQATLAIVKPFLDEKTRNKIFLHGNNLSTLHEHLPTDILPADLGGTGPAFNPGLWAEPVIHSAMKEAELAAIKRDKEKAERAEMVKSVNNTNISNDEIKKASQLVDNSTSDDSSKSIKDKNITSDKQKIDSITNDVGHSNLLRKSDESSNIDKSIRGLDTGTNDKDNVHDAQGSLVDFTNEEIDEGNGNVKKDVTNTEMQKQDLTSKDENKNEDLRTHYGEYKDENSITVSLDNLEVLKDDIETLQMDSETNSNEFEMVPSNLENEDSSKDNSLDLKIEKVVLKNGKSQLPEEANLIM